MPRMAMINPPLLSRFGPRLGPLWAPTATTRPMTTAPTQRQSPLGSKLWNLSALALALVGFSNAALAQVGTDQVTHYNPRTERVVMVTGSVETNGLDGVTVKTGEESTVKLDASNVLRIVWGDTPQAYTDARTYWTRGDYESALAQFRLASSDSEARPVVQAAARMQSAECLLHLGATDAARFEECGTEAQRYIDDYANGRALPQAMALKARALWLQGKAELASAAFIELFEKGKAKTAGFPQTLCLKAGLDGAWTSLEYDNTGKARELFTACQAGFQTAAEEAAPGARASLASLAAISSTGEGFALLTSGDARGAKAFFENKISQADLSPAGQFSAALGLGESLLADGQAAEAQIHLARASALDPSGRDRTARAMLGLVKALRAGEGPAAAQATILLTKIKTAYGDTPSAFHAAKLN